VPLTLRRDAKVRLGPAVGCETRRAAMPILPGAALAPRRAMAASRTNRSLLIFLGGLLTVAFHGCGGRSEDRETPASAGASGTRANSGEGNAGAAGASGSGANAGAAGASPRVYCGQGEQPPDYSTIVPCECAGLSCEPGRWCKVQYHLGGTVVRECTCGDDGLMQCTDTWPHFGSGEAGMGGHATESTAGGAGELAAGGGGR
jgi:hypothetical protein